MSRIGKHAIKIPSEIAFKANGNEFLFSVKGKEKKYLVDESLGVEVKEDTIKIFPIVENKFSRSVWGTTHRNLTNIIIGLSKGFSTSIELVGVGYRASVAGRVLTLQLGFSHNVVYNIPEGIEIKCEKPTLIIVYGDDKQKVNQVCACLRNYRKPEPYNEKGIFVGGEKIIKKEGKKK